MKPTLTKLKSILPIAALPFVLLAAVVLFASVILATSRNAEHIDRADKLNGFDFSEKIAHISPDVFEREELAVENGEFVTYRLTLDLTEGTVFRG
jgi:choline-glycine betaine transporter